MERNIFKYILSNSLKQQLVILTLSLCALPFYYASLDLPKQIINKVIDQETTNFPTHLTQFGFKVGSFNQLELLAILCSFFLLLVLTNGGFKYAINVYKGLLGETMLRKLRYHLFSIILKIPLIRFKNVSEGEMVSIISSEVEPLGGFIGDAFALPIYQGGLLLTAISFIFFQDPIMGFAVIALYPIQIIIIPRLQYQVNQLGKARISEVRKLSNNVAESVYMAREIRLIGTAPIEQQQFDNRLSKIFDIRYQIYRKKFFIKFLNNFLAQLTPFFFFSIGGYFVIKGELTLGALIAVLAAYKDLAPPWKELLDYFQQQQDARVKYEQIVIHFENKDTPTNGTRIIDRQDLAGTTLKAINLSITSDDDLKINSANFEITEGTQCAIIGPTNSGKSALAETIGGLLAPYGGILKIGGIDITALSNDQRNEIIGYADNQPAFQDKTVFDNLIYGQNTSIENVEMVEKVLSIINLVGLESTLFELGIRTTIAEEEAGDLITDILNARLKLKNDLGNLPKRLGIAFFEIQQFNENLSLGENILFGEPVGEKLTDTRLIDTKYLRDIIKKTALEEPLCALGHSIAEDLTVSGDIKKFTPSYLLHHSVPESDEIAMLQTIVARVPHHSLSKLRRSERRKLQSLALQFTAANNKEFPNSKQIREKILDARVLFADQLPKELLNSVAFFRPDSYNFHLSIRDNIIFGKSSDLITHNAASEELNEILYSIINETEILGKIRREGLNFRLGSKALSMAEQN